MLVPSRFLTDPSTLSYQIDLFYWATTKPAWLASQICIRQLGTGRKGPTTSIG